MYISRVDGPPPPAAAAAAARWIARPHPLDTLFRGTKCHNAGLTCHNAGLTSGAPRADSVRVLGDLCGTRCQVGGNRHNVRSCNVGVYCSTGGLASHKISFHCPEHLLLLSEYREIIKVASLRWIPETVSSTAREAHATEQVVSLEIFSYAHR